MLTNKLLTVQKSITSSGNFLFMWGAGYDGQLGDNTADSKSSPVQIGSNSWTAVTAGFNYTAAIRSDGLLFTWGYNSSGQLGNNDPTLSSQSSPVQIGSNSWIAVSAGVEHTAAIRSDGLLFTWGYNSSGQLGDNTADSKSSPVQIGSNSWIAVSVSAGGEHIAAIRSDGLLFTWGYNSFGQLGNNDPILSNQSSPVQIGSNSWITVSAGSGHTAAIRSDGLLFTWGYNSDDYGFEGGQLGDNTIDSKSSPVQIGTNSWSKVSANRYQTAAIRSDGLLFTWGVNSDGRLGNNDPTLSNQSSPVQIGSSSWTAVSFGRDHAAALL